MTEPMTLTVAVSTILVFLLGLLWAYLQKVVPPLVEKWKADLNETQLHQVEVIVREAVLMAQQIGVRDALTNEGKKLLAEAHVQAELDRLGIPIDAATVGAKIEAEVASQHWEDLFKVKKEDLPKVKVESLPK